MIPVICYLMKQKMGNLFLFLFFLYPRRLHSLKSQRWLSLRGTNGRLHKVPSSFQFLDYHFSSFSLQLDNIGLYDRLRLCLLLYRQSSVFIYLYKPKKDLYLIWNGSDEDEKKFSFSSIFFNIFLFLFFLPVYLSSFFFGAHLPSDLY